MIDQPKGNEESYGVYEAKTRLSELLDRVAAGGEVLITRHGQPVARLVPHVTRTTEPAEAAAKLAKLRATGAKLGFNLSSVEILELRDEGRR